MSNKRITDLTELTNPTTDDVFPVVDIATNTTTKVQLGNLPVPTAVTTALATKQDTLVSGTNIKTVNSTSLVGSGNVAVQETLVSGTNIKTLNSTSLLGSGDIVLTANPSGVAGAIQFSDGSAFASDATNLFWDDTNNRLGIGTNAPTASIEATTFKSSSINDNGTVLQFLPSYNMYTLSSFAIGAGDIGARLGIKGYGSTSATTSLLVQNSAGTAAMTVKDDLSTSVKTLYIDNSIEGATSGRMNIISQYDLAIRPNTGGVGFAEGFGFSVNGSALIEMQSTTKGFLPPRMTTTQKNAISSPAAGLVVYDNTTNKLCCYNGSTWNDLF
jgi:hypothetical protein